MMEVPAMRRHLPKMGDWAADAACKGVDPNVFVPLREGPAFEASARRICESCPVQAQCLDYAVQYLPDGVWGGRNATERRSLKRALRFGTPAPRKHRKTTPSVHARSCPVCRNGEMLPQPGGLESKCTSCGVKCPAA